MRNRGAAGSARATWTCGRLPSWPHSAQEVVNGLVAAGIQAVLNFAPIILQVPPHVVVNNVDLAIELENLSYFIR
jgi:NADH/NAD ratio-sensing transcriptional regulator Rex